MRTRRRRLRNVNDVQEAPRSSVAGYTKNVTLFQYLISEYGSLEFILDIAESGIDFAGRFFRNKKKYHYFLNLLRYGIPAIVFISQLLDKLKKFREIKKGLNTVTSEENEKIKSLLNIDGDKIKGNKIKGNKINVNYMEISLGSEVSRWLLHRPSTKYINIIGYYQYEDLQSIKDVYREDDSTILILIEHNSNKYVWLLRMYEGYENMSFIRTSQIWTREEKTFTIQDLKGAIYKDFIRHFDIKNNVLILDGSGLQIYPRQKVAENIMQVDIKKQATDIKKILEKGKKRGYVYVGVPGTGKSTSIHKLEAILTEYPIIYVSNSCLSSSYGVSETFETIRYLQPCIAVIEDLDSCGFDEKSSTLGEFLEQVDDVDENLNIVILSSVNDTSLVHYSLINRPGRFDEVIMIRTPKTIEEVYSVMECRYKKNQKKDSNLSKDFIKVEDIDEDIITKIIERSYTQADICEIIEKALLRENFIDNETLIMSLNELEESKKALKECDFKGSDPFVSDKKVDECPPAQKGRLAFKTMSHTGRPRAN